MKRNKWIWGALVFSAPALFGTITSTKAEDLIPQELYHPTKIADPSSDPLVVFLVDPNDPKTNPFLSETPTTKPAKAPAPTTQPAKASPDPVVVPPVLNPSKAEPPPSTSTPATQPSANTKKKRSVDDIIKEYQETRGSLNKRQQRIVAYVKAQQKAFIELLKNFLNARFDAQDDQAVPEFNKIRDQVVKSVMDSWDQKTYYERLYLINTAYLQNQQETARFQSLDRALRDRWMSMEEHRKKIRQIITIGCTFGGAALGGLAAYKASSKFLATSADEHGLSLLTKYAGRAGFVLFGVGVGASLGYYVGFLGSDALFHYQRDFLDPVDGTEDLREVLDLIDSL